MAFKDWFKNIHLFHSFTKWKEVKNSELYQIRSCKVCGKIQKTVIHV